MQMWSPPRSIFNESVIIIFSARIQRQLPVCAMVLLLAGGARAGTSTLSASVTVSNNCTVSTAALAFGTYDPIGTHRSGGANLDASGSVTIACVRGVAPSIGLGLGANASGITRRMIAGAGEYLDYELYKPATATAGAACTFSGAVVWGTAGSNLFSASAAPDKVARTYNVCGTVAAGQDPAIGTYSDTVIATVTF